MDTSRVTQLLPFGQPWDQEKSNSRYRKCFFVISIDLGEGLFDCQNENLVLSFKNTTDESRNRVKFQREYQCLS